MKENYNHKKRNNGQTWRSSSHPHPRRSSWCFQLLKTLQHLKPLMHVKHCNHCNNLYCICQQLNWSHFKSWSFLENQTKMQKHIYLGQMIGWTVKDFRIMIKSKDFVRHWQETLDSGYKSLRPINADWIGLQNSFRQQYSKIGNTREQLLSCMEIFPFWWKYRDNRCLHTSYKTGCDHTLRLSGTTDTWKFSRIPFLQNYTGFFSQ